MYNYKCDESYDGKEGFPMTERVKRVKGGLWRLVEGKATERSLRM